MITFTTASGSLLAYHFYQIKNLTSDERLLMRSALFAERKEDLFLARSLFRQAVESICSNNVDVKERRLECIGASAHLAEMYYKSHLFKKSEKMYLTILDKFDERERKTEKYVYILQQLALLNAKHLNNTEKAVNFINSAIEIMPIGPILETAGDVYMFAGNFKTALDYYEKALQTSPADHKEVIINNCAVCLYKMGDEGKARKLLFDQNIPTSPF